MTPIATFWTVNINIDAEVSIYRWGKILKLKATTTHQFCIVLPTLTNLFNNSKN